MAKPYTTSQSVVLIQNCASSAFFPFVFIFLSKMRQPERKIRFNAPCSIFSLLSLYMSNVSLTDEEGNELRFAQQPYAKFNIVSIQDVKGYLYVGFGSYDSVHPHLAFAKGMMGRGTPVSAGTPVEVESAEVYRALLPILYFDSALGLNEDELIRSLSGIVAHHENPAGCGCIPSGRACF